MVSVDVKWLFTITMADPSDDAALDDHVDQMMRQLLTLEDCDPRIADSAVGCNTATGEVEIELTAAGSSPADAMQLAESSLRAAIHAAGGFTPGWDDDAGNPAAFAQYHDERIVMETVNKPIPA